jgi:hypothetical protein
MRNLLIVLIIALTFSGVAFAQESTPDPSQIGVDTAQQRLQEVSIEKFEDPGFWSVTMPLDHGVVTHRRFEGTPLDKQPIEGEDTVGIDEPDQYVLAVKAQYFRRVNTTISIVPSRPIAIPGITKTISLWVVGRNFNHRLSVVVEDYFGNRIAIPMGMLNFSGWKQMTVAIPPTVEQTNPFFAELSGLRILGFIIEPELTETYGTYYVYFDDLRAVTDLFAEENRDPDDMADGW